MPTWWACAWTSPLAMSSSATFRPTRANSRSNCCSCSAAPDPGPDRCTDNEKGAAMFQDRTDAAHRLAAGLHAFQGQNPLVLAIPRGAVPMGRVIARALGGDLDVVLVRKLHAPFLREVAVGAVDESGWTYVAPQAERMGADAAYLAQEKRTQLQALRARRALYTP